MIIEWNEKEKRTALETDERIEKIKRSYEAELENMRNQLEKNRRKQEFDYSADEEIFLIKDEKLMNECDGEERTISEQKYQHITYIFFILTNTYLIIFRVRGREESMEFDHLKQHVEIEKLIREHEGILALAREQHKLELKAVTDRYEHVQLEADQLREKVESLEQQIEQWANASEDSSKRKDLQESNSDICMNHSKALSALEEERNMALEDARKSVNLIDQLHHEITELKLLLERNNESTRKMEEKHQAELAAVQKLSVSYEHLQSELEKAEKIHSMY
uniref:Myosin_tail_1 domain-containing protein n=1 Tax=Heterorhabditis bacteriophora TaxID=37862 RepID=A0A1I7XJW6_HETBA